MSKQDFDFGAGMDSLNKAGLKDQLSNSMNRQARMRNGKPPVSGLRSGLGKEPKLTHDLGGISGQTMGSNSFATKTISQD